MGVSQDPHGLGVPRTLWTGCLGGHNLFIGLLSPLDGGHPEGRDPLSHFYIQYQAELLACGGWSMSFHGTESNSLVCTYLKKKKVPKILLLLSVHHDGESSVPASPAVIDSSLFISDLPTSTKDLWALTARACLYRKHCTLQDGFWVNCAPSIMSTSRVNPDLLNFSRFVLMEAGVPTWELASEKWSGWCGAGKSVRIHGVSRNGQLKGEEIKPTWFPYQSQSYCV